MKQWMVWPFLALITLGCGGNKTTDPAQIAKQQAEEKAAKEAELKALKQKQIETFVKNNAKNLASFAMKFAKSDDLTKEIQTLVTPKPKDIKAKKNSGLPKFMQPADVLAIYEARQFTPIFVTNSKLDDAADPLFKELRQLDRHGLGTKIDTKSWIDAQNALNEIQTGAPLTPFVFTQEEEAKIVSLILQKNIQVADPDAVKNLVIDLVKDDTHIPRLHNAIVERTQIMTKTARQAALLDVLTTDIAMRFAREMAFDNLSHLTEEETKSLGKRPNDKKYRAISAARTKTWLNTLAAVMDAPAPGLKKDIDDTQAVIDETSENHEQGDTPSELLGTAKAEIDTESEEAKDAHAAETQAANAQKAKLKNAKTVQELVDSLYPAHPQYKLLMEIRNRYASLESWPTVKQKKLRRNRPSPAVPALKRRLSAEGYYHGDISEEAAKQEGFDIYDDELRAAVHYYHDTHQLAYDEEKGIQKSFWTSLNIPVEKRLAQIDENLRRWHKTQITESPYYIYINVPDFHGEIWRDGKLAYRFPIVVGNAKRQCDPTTKMWKYINATPLMHARMLYLEYNPYWNVPPRIEQEDYIEKINADPTWLQREGFEYYTEDGHTILRQLPSEDNALGRVKFIFPNPHSTFLHDSPQKGLFRYPIRAFSHGCMRVWEPLELAKRILQYDGQWYDELATEIEDMVTRRIVLKTRFDVFIDYFTVRIDEDGNAHFLADPYRYVRYALEPPKPKALECEPQPKAWIPRAALGGGVGAEITPTDAQIEPSIDGVSPL